MDENDFMRISEISRSIRDIIEDRSKAENVLIWKAWMDSAGEIISSKATLRGIRGATLLIDVKDEQWCTVLLAMKSQLINKMNRWIGEERFNDIIFEIRKAF